MTYEVTIVFSVQGDDEDEAREAIVEHLSYQGVTVPFDVTSVEEQRA